MYKITLEINITDEQMKKDLLADKCTMEEFPDVIRDSISGRGANVGLVIIEDDKGLYLKRTYGDNSN